jgi:formate dehydrogenase subunit delta
VNVEKLKRMANQIGAFFDADPDQETAVAEIAGHLQRFWNPDMRTELIRYAAAGGEGLRDSVRRAAARLAETAPTGAPPPSAR